MNNENILIPFLLTLFAGLSTGIGSLLAFTSKKLKPSFLSGSLGFSAGVMIYVSFVELFQQAKESLLANYSHYSANIILLLAFFGGIGIIALIDKLVPSFENPHELKNLKKTETLNSLESQTDKKLLRMGLFSALAIAIHNFPEGFATFIASLKDPKIGLSIAVAIAIHNIPEGIAVSVPIYYATKSKKKAFWLSFLSGLSEPIGAIIGFFILKNFFTPATFGITFSAISGIMVYISLDELLPTAEEYGKHHIAISGLIFGMLVMAISLLLLS